MSSAAPNSSKVVLKRKKSSLCELKVAVYGDRNVGKSALVVRFLTRRYIMEYEHGTDNKYKHEVMIENEPVIFEVLDISANSSLNNLDLTTNCPDLILLVYSITDRQSFNFIRNFLRNLAQIKAMSTNHIPLVAIVGNKSDLVHLRQVSVEEGEILSTEYSELTIYYYGEVSAADQLVNQVFLDLYRWVKKNKIVSKSMTSSLLDRMVIGIKGAGNNGSSNS